MTKSNQPENKSTNEEKTLESLIEEKIKEFDEKFPCQHILMGDKECSCQNGKFRKILIEYLISIAKETLEAVELERKVDICECGHPRRRHEDGKTEPFDERTWGIESCELCKCKSFKENNENAISELKAKKDNFLNK